MTGRLELGTEEAKSSHDQRGKVMPPTPITVDPMYFVSAHEAGHAVAYIMAHRALERDYPSFRRVFIRREFSSPYIDDRNRKVDCIGMCEAPDLYNVNIGLGLFYQEPEPCPGWQNQMLRKMEWTILTSLAGPFAESASRDARSGAVMRHTARRLCGGEDDYSCAAAVLLDLTKASKQRHRISHFEDRTRDLVLNSWAAIDALAKTLLINESLDYDSAYAVVEPLLEAPLDCFTFER